MTLHQHQYDIITVPFACWVIFVLTEKKKQAQLENFLAHLYECTGRALALPQASALEAADSFALAVVLVLAKCPSFMFVKVFCVMGKALSDEISFSQTGPGCSKHR